jgi:hypothetical protein
VDHEDGVVALLARRHFERADAETIDDDPADVHPASYSALVLFYYLCARGEERHREAYPQGAQSKDADVHKWVTMHSGSPAVCQREHDGAHAWHPDEGGEEERVVRGFAVLQWDKHGFEPGKAKPKVGERFDSPWGPSLVTERADDPTTGTYLLLRIYPHGYRGKPGELGTERTDAPRELVGKL